MLARSERFELPTLGFEVRCSIQLSYERINVFNHLVRGQNSLALTSTENDNQKTFSAAPITRVGQAEPPKENATGDILARADQVIE
jgi:hypothetical protein